MKKLLLLPFTLLFACGSAPAKETNQPTGSKSKLAMEFAYIDSVINTERPSTPQDNSALTALGGQELSIEDVNSIVKAEREKGVEAWDSIKSLCDENKNLDALNYFNQNKSTIYIHLSVTKLTYYFHTQVLFKLLSAVDQPEDVVDRCIAEALEYDYLTTKAVMGLSDKGYITPHFAELINTMTSLAVKMEAYDKAIEYWSDYLPYSKSEFGEKSLDYACSIATLGKFYGWSNNKREGIKYVKQAKKIMDEIKPTIAIDMQATFDMVYSSFDQKIEELSK